MTKEFKKGDKVYWINDEGNKFYRTVDEVESKTVWLTSGTWMPIHGLHHAEPEQKEYRCQNGDLIEEGKEYLDIDGDKVHCVKIIHNSELPIVVMWSDFKAGGRTRETSFISLWQDTRIITIDGESHEVSQDKHNKIMEIINND